MKKTTLKHYSGILACIRFPIMSEQLYIPVHYMFVLMYWYH